MHQGTQNHIALHTQMPHTNFAELLSKAFVNIPVAAGLPRRVNCRGQGVNKGMHVAGIEVVFFIPGCSGQYDVRVQTGRTHAKVQCHQQIKLAFGCFVMPHYFFRLGFVMAHVFSLNTVAGSQQML